MNREIPSTPFRAGSSTSLRMTEDWVPELTECAVTGSLQLPLGKRLFSPYAART
jgi:hypothetical protein